MTTPGPRAAAPPPDIRIDLRHPTFTPEVEEMLRLGAELADACPIDEVALHAQARAETGLDDFGDDGYLVPLRVLLGAYRDEAGFSAMGRVTIHTQLLQLLKNRLLIEDLIARHPEILDERVERPIIIAGLPRTGTTHLQNVIAADPNLRSLAYWESIEPVLAPAEAAALEPGSIDPRIERSDASLAFLTQALPHFPAMFDIGTHHAHEEINLLAIDFSTMYFDTMAPIPTWRAHYLATDQTPHYRYLKRVLQVLQFLRPVPQDDGAGTRWVLKSPQNLEQFGPLMNVFPDATVLVTHRDPVAVTASMATMLSYVSWLSAEAVDTERIGQYWLAILEDLLNAAVRDRELLPPDQSLDVRFDQFMADEWSMLQRIYALAGQSFETRTQQALRAYLDGHGRNRHGRLRYDLADFGFEEQDLRRRFAPYTERFAVPAERVG
jgi:hypothetical protein